MKLSWNAILLLTMLAWSSYHTVAKALLAHVSPLTLSFFRLVFALPFFIGYLAWKKKIVFPKKTDLVPFLANVVFGTILAQILASAGIAWSTASAGAVLININPALVALFGIAFFGHTLSKKQSLGILLATASALGIAAFSGSADLLNSDTFLGNLFLIGSAACIALAALYSVPLSKSLGGVFGQFWGLLPGVFIFGIVWVFSNPLAELSRITFWDWLGFLWIGVVVTGICWSIMFEALDKVGAIEASTFKNLVPVFSVFLAGVFLAEPLSPVFLAFFTLCLAGVYLTSKKTQVIRSPQP